MKKFNKLVFIPLIISLCMLCFILYAKLSSNVFIINMGVQKYRFMMIFLTIVLVLLIVISIALVLVNKRIKNNSVDYRVDSKLVSRVNSIRGDLKRLSSKFQYEFKVAKLFIEAEKVLNSVLEYYTSIESDIRKSGYTELADADDIIVKVLDAMVNDSAHLIRLGKLYSSTKDESLQNELFSSYQNLVSKRDKAVDFITSVLRYINSSDTKEDSKTLASINSYKDIVLGEISSSDSDLLNKYTQ